MILFPSWLAWLILLAACLALAAAIVWRHAALRVAEQSRQAAQAASEARQAAQAAAAAADQIRGLLPSPCTPRPFMFRDDEGQEWCSDVTPPQEPQS